MKVFNKQIYNQNLRCYRSDGSGTLAEGPEEIFIQDLLSIQNPDQLKSEFRIRICIFWTSKIRIRYYLYESGSGFNKFAVVSIGLLFVSVVFVPHSKSGVVPMSSLSGVGWLG